MACQRCHEGIVSAPRQDNSLKADISVVADVVVEKYADHKPLYRQQQAFERLNIPISRQTLCDWTGWCSDQAQPLVKAMADYIRAQRLIQSDETLSTDAIARWPDGNGALMGLWVAVGGSGV
jgi:transposase